MVMLHPQNKADIRGVHQVGYHIVAFVAPVEDDNRFVVEGVALKHFHQCARLILPGGGLNHRVKVGAVVDVKQRTQMHLIVPRRRTVIADEAGRAGVTGHIDCGAVTGQNAAAFVATIGLTVCAGGCKVQKHLAEYCGRDLTAALRHGGGSSVNPGAVQLLRQRPALGGNQELDKLLGRQFLTAGCVAHIHTIGHDTFQITLVQVGD